MKDFSQLIKAKVNFPRVFYHITPTSNVQSIIEMGLLRGSTRSTNGIETQAKIYLTPSITNIPDPFPNHFGWDKKDMTVIEVSIPESDMGYLEEDPEYDAGTFYMLSKNVPSANLESLGRHIPVLNEEGKYSFTSKPDEAVLESTEESPILKGSRKLGVYSNGSITGYAYKLLDGRIYFNGILNTASWFKEEGYDIQELPAGYEHVEGKHFHARE